jgi:hypothetical protein
MLGVYTAYPLQICAHVAKADMLLFHDDFNKIIFPFHRLRRSSSGVEHYIFFSEIQRTNLTDQFSAQNAGNDISGLQISRMLMMMTMMKKIFIQGCPIQHSWFNTNKITELQNYNIYHKYLHII